MKVEVKKKSYTNLLMQLKEVSLDNKKEIFFFQRHIEEKERRDLNRRSLKLIQQESRQSTWGIVHNEEWIETTDSLEEALILSENYPQSVIAYSTQSLSPGLDKDISDLNQGFDTCIDSSSYKAYFGLEALFRNKEDYSEDRGTLLLYYKDKWVVYDRRALLFSGNNEQDAIDYAMINHCYDAWITCVGNEA